MNTTIENQENSTNNIFSKGCLVILEVSIWSGLKKIPKSIASEKLGSDWANGSKALVPNEALKPIKRVHHFSKSYLEARSLPFPIPKALFVPLDLIESIDNHLKVKQVEFYNEVAEFKSRYSDHRETAKEVLNGLFNETDYPIDITNKFSFAYRFITVGCPENNSILSPELVKQEKEKFIATMENARLIAVDALRIEFSGIIDSCVERLTPNVDGSRKKFKNSLTGNFTDFFETFKSRNIFDDKELKELVTKAENIVNGFDVQELRDNDTLAMDIKNSMSTLNTELEKSIVDAPLRAIDLS